VLRTVNGPVHLGEKLGAVLYFAPVKLAHEFSRLPLQFDADRLAAEVAGFAESEWRAHPQGHAGNSAIPLVSAGGDPANDSTLGPMCPTPQLERCEYLRQVLAALGAPIGRTRLMRIAGHGEATAHADINYYWSQRVRVHIPVLTYPGVRFICGEREVFMDHGECWIFDTWRRHNVLNPDDRPRIHLVADTVGSDSFWQMVTAADKQPAAGAAAPRPVAYQPGWPVVLETESHNFPVVMSPWEMDSLAESLGAEALAANAAPSAEAFVAALAAVRRRWRALWARFGADAAGWPLYQAELQRAAGVLAPFRGRLTLPNGTDALFAVEQWILLAALNPDLTPPAPLLLREGGSKPLKEAGSKPLTEGGSKPLREGESKPAQERFDRPVFIVSAPRSGSSLLFETLARAAGVYTIGGESHQLIEGIPGLEPAARGYESNRLTAADATPGVVDQLYASLAGLLRDRDGRPPVAGGPVRLLEKTPKNALRVPFLAAAFPEARFIFLYRDPRENLASIIEAWGSGRFITYPKLPGWQGPPWSLLLIPGWQALSGRTPAEIAAAQWQAANWQILDDLSALPAERQIVARYADLLADPQAEMERLCRWAGFTWDRRQEGTLPLSRHTLTPPDPGKWRQHAAEIEPLLPGLQPLADDVAQRLADSSNELPAAMAPTHTLGATDSPTSTPQPPHSHDPAHAGSPTPAGGSPMRSQHTVSFPQLLSALGISLFVSTYQAGQLMLLRAQGELLNTHFRAFRKPMGLALREGRLALGTELELLEFGNVPAVARQLAPAGQHDAAFMPRGTFVTGDVQVHDIAWAGDTPCFVNTRFSCLCAPSREYSFVPTWRPRFISALAPEDRCHLNGLAVRDGRPAYATALAESDTAAGWRDHKRAGGILMDVDSSEIVVRGLSMPHSPRWHAGRLWVLNSGEGGLGVVDLASGHYQEVARLPGFTRGLAFQGRYAFVGLSQVRESAVFSGIAIAELPLEQRACGVWVVDVTTGQSVAFVHFQDLVQEIFAVEAAPGMRFPDVLSDDKERISSSFVLPDEALQTVPPALRARVDKGLPDHAA
jgi:uncharacterized protein (TIGR03032 family)